MLPEVRCRLAQRWKLSIRMKQLRALEQLLLRLHVIGVRDAAIHRTHRRTLFRVEVLDTLRALLRHNDWTPPA